MNSQELLELIESIYQAPLGNFPRGGIKASLKLSLSRTSTAVTLRDQDGDSASIKIRGDSFFVSASEGLGGDTKIYRDLTEALTHLVDLFTHKEIRRVVRSRDA